MLLSTVAATLLSISPVSEASSPLPPVRVASADAAALTVSLTVAQTLDPKLNWSASPRNFVQDIIGALTGKYPKAMSEGNRRDLTQKMDRVIKKYDSNPALGKAKAMRCFFARVFDLLVFVNLMELNQLSDVNPFSFLPKPASFQTDAMKEWAAALDDIGKFSKALCDDNNNNDPKNPGASAGDQLFKQQATDDVIAIATAAKLNAAYADIVSFCQGPAQQNSLPCVAFQGEANKGNNDAVKAAAILVFLSAIAAQAARSIPAVP